MHAPNQLRVVGNHVAAQDGLAKVKGTALYTFDRSLPGMLHAKVLRSPHAHARIASIDTRRAAAMPGVAAVMTAKDLVGLNPLYGVRIKDQPVLAIDKVRHYGDVVAAVAAERRRLGPSRPSVSTTSFCRPSCRSRTLSHQTLLCCSISRRSPL
jgi:CO/xanthine dehydrogenase Mo-binding subunit